MSQYSRAEVQPQPWNGNPPSITTAHAALTTSKSAATVNALATAYTALIQPDPGTVAIEMRFRVDGSDGDSNVLNLYAMAGASDHYTLIGTLTLTAGTQVDADSNLFCDTISIASELWIDDIVILSDAANGIARVALNLQGYTHILAIATTLNSTAVYVDWRQI
jgi:hypothetical protein